MLVNSSRRIKKIITINMKYSEIIIFLYSLSVFADLSYFTWYTYPYSWLRILVKLLKYVAYVFICIWILSNRSTVCVTRNRIIAFLTVVIVISCNHFLAENISLINRGDIFIIIDVFILLFLFGEKEVLSVFKYMIIIFLVITLPSVIYYVISKMMYIPFSVLESDQEGKLMRGIFYKWHPMGLIINSDNYYGTISAERICGVFDEPGVVGTFSALFLGAYFQKKPRINIVNVLLLIDGFMSFSLAFYILLLILIVIELAKKSIVKLGAFMFLFTFLFFAFMNTNFDNKQLSRFQSRFNLDDKVGEIVVNNRYDSVYEDKFNVFFDEGGYALLFGKGYEASSSDEGLNGASIYTRLIYDYGIIGTLLYLAVFVVIALSYGISKKNISFLIMFFASVYQRPYILKRPYILLFISALCFMNYYSESDKKNNNISVVKE